MTTIAITGVTGHVGGRVARQLATEDLDASLALIARREPPAPVISGADTGLPLLPEDFGRSDGCPRQMTFRQCRIVSVPVPERRPGWRTA
jgi:nucleoside-diphosphate-sugar epimerase